MFLLVAFNQGQWSLIDESKSQADLESCLEDHQEEGFISPNLFKKIFPEMDEFWSENLDCSSNYPSLDEYDMSGNCPVEDTKEFFIVPKSLIGNERDCEETILNSLAINYPQPVFLRSEI